MTVREKAITLPDGRRLAYTVQGRGYPVMVLHGSSGCRYSYHPDTSIVRRLRMRLIVPERPGYGGSDPFPGRVLSDTVQDVVALAEALQIKRFGVMGVSAGGAHAAACAYALPERVLAAAIVAAPAPMIGPRLRMTPFLRMGRFAACWLPRWLLRTVLWHYTRAEVYDTVKTFDYIFSTLNEADRTLFAEPTMRRHYIKNRVEALRRGVQGVVDEARAIFARPWGFAPEDITVPVHLWFWDDDDTIPPAHGQYLARRIPRSIFHRFPGGGHNAFLRQWESILRALRDAMRSPM